MRLYRFAPLLLAGALTVAGCGGAGPSAPANTTGSPTAIGYQSVRDLANAFTGAIGNGASCDPSMVSSHPQFQQIICKPTAVLVVFDSEAARSDFSAKTPVPGSDTRVTGSNWAIQTSDRQTTLNLREKLGGLVDYGPAAYNTPRPSQTQ